MATSLELKPEFNGKHGEYLVPVDMLVEHNIPEDELTRAVEELSATHPDYILITEWVIEPERHGLLIKWAYLPERIGANGLPKPDDASSPTAIQGTAIRRVAPTS